jgi:hypothetical protein
MAIGSAAFGAFAFASGCPFLDAFAADAAFGAAGRLPPPFRGAAALFTRDPVERAGGLSLSLFFIPQTPASA